MISTDPQVASTSPLTSPRLSSAESNFGDVNAEFEALLSNCGVYEMPWRAKVSLTGADRVRWLNGIVTNNLRDLSMGRGLYSFLLNPQGRILGDLYAFNRGRSLLVDTDVSQLEKVQALFDRYIIMDDVEVSRETLSALGVKGPKAGEVLRRVGFEIPDLQPLEFADLIWKDISFTVVRGDSPMIEAYEVWASADDIKAFLHSLLTSGAKNAGTTAFNLMRIAEGVPQYGQDIRERDLPQETNQQRALHFAKGCYIGQEIVERIRSRGNVHRTFSGFKVEGPLPPPGTKFQVNGKEVGEITSSASLPLRSGEYPVALGYIRREVADQPFLSDGTTLAVVSLPFTDVFKN